MNFVEWLKVVLLGIVEGITEWLPISSTGHLILVDEFVKLNQSEEFMKMFNVVIQLGAILAISYEEKCSKKKLVCQSGRSWIYERIPDILQ